MKRTQHSGCFIFLIELDWLNFALDTGADFHWLNTEQLYLDVLLYSNTGIEKFSWGWIIIRVRIRYSMNSKVNIRIRWMQIFFRFVTSLTVSMLELWWWGRGFDAWSGCSQMVTIWIAGCLQTGKSSQYIAKVKSVYHVFSVDKSNTSLLGWRLNVVIKLFMRSLSQSYGASPAVWDHAVLLSTWHRWTCPP